MLGRFRENMRQSRSEIVREIAEEIGILLLLIAGQFVRAPHTSGSDGQQPRFAVLARLNFESRSRHLSQNPFRRITLHPMTGAWRRGLSGPARATEHRATVSTRPLIRWGGQRVSLQF